jgi:hypothetical protein
MPDTESNFGLGTSPQVWLFSDFNLYNQLRPIGYPMYLTMVQKARLERIRQARLLHDGRHWRLFLFEARTQFDFPEVRTMGRKTQLYVPYNLCKLISIVSANLLFGAEPGLKVAPTPEETEAIKQADARIDLASLVQGKYLAQLIERTAFHRLLYHTAIEASYDAEAYFESCIELGQVYVRRIDAADIFPLGRIQPDGQYKAYVKYNARNLGSDDKPDWRLLTTTYLPGKITRKVSQLNNFGFVLPRQLTLNEWPQEDPEDSPLEPETVTGIDRCTITYVPNLLARDFPVSDYDGLVETQDELNAKQTQISRVLAKHSDPKLAAPATAATQDGILPSNHDVYFFRSKDEIPQYLTWNAELASAITERDQARSAMLLLSQTSPLLLGLREGAVSSHNAYKSVRIETTPSLSKAQAKALIWKPAIRRVLSVCQDLEQTLPAVRYDRRDIAVEVKDGLPIDTDALANEIATYRGCGSMSVRRSVELQIEDPVARAAELADLAAEKADATPSILMAPPSQAGDEGGGDIAPAEEHDDQAVEVAA